MKARRTEQLSAVHDVVHRAHDHPSADEVFARVRQRLPHVSLGTVYRNLQKLAALQQLRIVQLANRAARYDGMLEAHDHFLCEQCGELTDLLQRDSKPELGHLDRQGYAVSSRSLTFYGLCPSCRSTSRRRLQRRVAVAQS
jgi:Fur family ferric uptake transcriptional regulator